MKMGAVTQKEIVKARTDHVGDYYILLAQGGRRYFFQSFIRTSNHEQN